MTFVRHTVWLLQEETTKYRANHSPNWLEGSLGIGWVEQQVASSTMQILYPVDLENKKEHQRNHVEPESEPGSWWENTRYKV